MSMAIIFALAAAAGPPDTPPTVQIIQEGREYVMRSLVGEMPLYTYDKDEPAKSNCTGPCAKAWPPLPAGAREKPIGKWTVIKRPDGSYQWAFGGKPVYSFARDKNSIASGNGQGGVWHLLPTTPVPAQ